MQFLRQRPTLGSDQELDKFLRRQLLTAGCVAHIHTISYDTFQITLVQVGEGRHIVRSYFLRYSRLSA